MRKKDGLPGAGACAGRQDLQGGMRLKQAQYLGPGVAGGPQDYGAIAHEEVSRGTGGQKGQFTLYTIPCILMQISLQSAASRGGPC